MQGENEFFSHIVLFVVLTDNSLFITTMAAHKGARAICLQDTISPGVIRCFEIAIKTFDEAVATSPSLEILGAILSQQVRVNS